MATLDVETEIVATLTKDFACRQYFEDGLHDCHFADKVCREIFEWAMNYFLTHGAMKTAPNAEVLSNRFENYNSIISKAKGAAPSYLIEQLKGLYIKRQAESVFQNCLPLMAKNPMACVTLLRDSVSAIVDNCRSEQYILEYGKDIEQYRRRVEEQRAVQGIPYPFEEMTEWTGGMKPGELTILVAPPATGKSYFACKAAYEAIKAGKNVLFASLELTIENIAQRIEYMAVNEKSVQIPIFDYQRGVRIPQYDRAMHSAQEHIASLPGKLFIEQPRVEDRTPAALVQSCKSHECDLLIVDQLQFVQKPKRDSLQESYGAALQEFKQQIMTPTDGIRIPLLLLHQMNRDGARSQRAGTGKVGSMTDIAGSAWVEQIADIVWGLGRNDEERNNNVMNIATLKARNVAPVGWRLNWDTNYSYQSSILRDENGCAMRLTEW